jgi:hypothetical protein
VREETAPTLAHANTLHSTLPGVQPSARRFVTIGTTAYKLGHIIHAIIVRLWDEQRLRIEPVPYECAVARTQPPVKGPQRGR